MLVNVYQAIQKSHLPLLVLVGATISSPTVITYCNSICYADVNECRNSPSPCDPMATCTNTPGSFQCTCNPGYAGDGIHCYSEFGMIMHATIM